MTYGDECLCATGYRRLGGSKTQAGDLVSLFDVLERNGLLSQDRLITGALISACWVQDY